MRVVLEVPEAQIEQATALAVSVMESAFEGERTAGGQRQPRRTWLQAH